MKRSGKDFNTVASKWDEKPRRVQLAAAVAASIKQHIPLNHNMTALEFGCGTALVTFNLIDQLGQVTAMDNSPGMLDIVKLKVVDAGLDNVDVCLTSDAVPHLQPQHYDFIFSSMVLHHVGDLLPVLQALVAALKPGGVIALADLDIEDGSFHTDSCGVEHHGIDRLWLGDQLLKLGMQTAQNDTAHTIIKNREVGEQRYPVFVVWASKE
jgi:SAM-dependent methyltransferase